MSLFLVSLCFSLLSHARRNGRAREAWVRSASAELSRMRVAAIACAYSLESIVKASKHLAHQVDHVASGVKILHGMEMFCLARIASVFGASAMFALTTL